MVRTRWIRSCIYTLALFACVAQVCGASIELALFLWGPLMKEGLRALFRFASLVHCLASCARGDISASR